MYLEPDVHLGWRHRPGFYEFYSPFKHGNAVMTFDRNGSRRNILATSTVPAALWLFGCSFVEGFSLSNEETFAWDLASRFKGEYAVVNFGTAGYGTYQSLLLMKQKLQEQSALGLITPKWIGYLLNDFHEPRNTGAYSFMRLLSPPKGGKIPLLPYCKLDREGSLSCDYAAAEVIWSISWYSRVVALINEAYFTFTLRSRNQNGETVTGQLIKQMHELAQGANSRFGVILFALSAEKKANYERFLRGAGIEFVDCDREERLSPEFSLPDGHPNAAMNKLIAQCVDAYLRTSVISQAGGIR